jgi:hypothetical protein
VTPRGSKWRRPRRFETRLHRKNRIPPSTRSRWEAKARIITHLKKVLPLTHVVVEDVQAVTRKEQFGLEKTTSKSSRSFESHALDGWVMAASVSGAEKPTCQRLWYVVPAILHRRQLHRLTVSKGGERKPYGGTHSIGLKRGTVVRHPKYGLCTVGGFDRNKQTISLHVYRTNKRLTQGAKAEDCRVLTWVAFRSWLVKERPKLMSQGSHPIPAPMRERLFPFLDKSQGLSQAEGR